MDTDIVSAPAVGSAAKIRFFIDHQRGSPGSFPHLDWPILLSEKAISPAGAVTEPRAPADVPLFEQVRSVANEVPFTGGPARDGAAHVAGLNFGRPGEVARCVGCHTGHTMIPVPARDAETLWTNLAPGATVTVSSSRDPRRNGGLIDRKVLKGEIGRYWNSAVDQTTPQWVKLAFPVPITVKRVRLYNPRPGDEANSSIQVEGATVELYRDTAAPSPVATRSVGRVLVSGTDVAFNNVRARVVKVTIDRVTGTFDGAHLASLAEVEVIGRGEAGS